MQGWKNSSKGTVTGAHLYRSAIFDLQMFAVVDGLAQYLGRKLRYSSSTAYDRKYAIVITP